MRVELRTLIRDHLLGDADVMALLTGGVHVGTALDDATMPYAVLTPGVGGAPEYNTGRQQIDQLTVRFQVWASEPDTAANAIEKIEARMLQRLDGVALKHMDTTKVGSDVFEEPDRDEAGNEVWQGVLTLELTLEWNPRA